MTDISVTKASLPRWVHEDCYYTLVVVDVIESKCRWKSIEKLKVVEKS